MTKVVIMVVMIASSFISPKLLELKNHVVNAKNEGNFQVVIVVGMITSSFITSKSLGLDIDVVSSVTV